MQEQPTHRPSDAEVVAAWQAQVIRAIRATPDGNNVFFAPQQFPWIGELEASWPEIRAEYDQLSRALDLLPGIEEISNSQSGLTTDRRWKVFPFCAYGHVNVNNERRCPRTARALQRIPMLHAAMFSILQPGKRIPAHNGVYCGVLRFHLGVKVPRPQTQCGISVGGQIAHWQEGQGMVFDDTHTHFAWNDSTEDRVVLLVDFSRPLTGHLRTINQRMIEGIGRGALVEGADAHWQAWESKYGEEFDRLRMAVI